MAKGNAGRARGQGGVLRGSAVALGKVRPCLGPEEVQPACPPRPAEHDIRTCPQPQMPHFPRVSDASVGCAARPTSTSLLLLQPRVSYIFAVGGTFRFLSARCALNVTSRVTAAGSSFLPVTKLQTPARITTALPTRGGRVYRPASVVFGLALRHALGHRRVADVT